MLSAEHNQWEKMLARSEGGVDFWHNGIVRTLLTAATVPLLLCLGLVLYAIRPGGTSLVLHYNVYFGVDLLGVWWQVYMLPLLGVLFLLLHTFLAKRFYDSVERIACYLMLLSAGMLAFGVLVASIGIVFINY